MPMGLASTTVAEMVTGPTTLRTLTPPSDTIGSPSGKLAPRTPKVDVKADLRSAPGLGPILAARVLAEVGDDPARFTTANGLRAFAGTAPITRASGRSHYVKARKVRNKRLGDACQWLAFVTLTKSAGATCPLRQTTSRRRPPQRRAAQPRQQAPRTHVVVSTTQRTLGRPRRLARPSDHISISGCLTPDPRGMSTSRWVTVNFCIWRRSAW
ncbi:transposase [Rhodococcus sp. ACS1]|uniref:transposase n=1 Tax=Rhodococcus sp. ACS1 TaxID=2028570 RepID=UPI0027BA2D39|nr:transposase [Rhodococcus sp. ACS1]